MFLFGHEHVIDLTVSFILYLILKSDAHAKISAANQLLLDIREKP